MEKQTLHKGLKRSGERRLLGEVIAGLSDHLKLDLAGMRIVLVALILVLDFHKAFVRMTSRSGMTSSRGY